MKNHKRKKVSKKMSMKEKIMMKYAKASTLMEIGEDIVDLIIKTKNYKKTFKHDK